MTIPRACSRAKGQSSWNGPFITQTGHEQVNLRFQVCTLVHMSHHVNSPTQPLGEDGRVLKSSAETNKLRDLGERRSLSSLALTTQAMIFVGSCHKALHRNYNLDPQSM